MNMKQSICVGLLSVFSFSALPAIDGMVINVDGLSEGVRMYSQEELNQVFNEAWTISKNIYRNIGYFEGQADILKACMVASVVIPCGVLVCELIEKYGPTIKEKIRKHRGKLCAALGIAAGSALGVHKELLTKGVHKCIDWVAA